MWEIHFRFYMDNLWLQQVHDILLNKIWIYLQYYELQVIWFFFLTSMSMFLNIISFYFLLWTPSTSPFKIVHSVRPNYCPFILCDLFSKVYMVCDLISYSMNIYIYIYFVVLCRYSTPQQQLKTKIINLQEYRHWDMFPGGYNSDINNIIMSKCN